MVRLFLISIMCGLSNYTVSTLGTGSYANVAHCTFTSPFIIELENQYKYQNTVMTTNYNAYADCTLNVYADIYYNDTYTYKITVKSIDVSIDDYYYYDRGNSTWEFGDNVDGSFHCNLSNGNGYSWTDNSTPYIISIAFDVNGYGSEPLELVGSAYYMNSSDYSIVPSTTMQYTVNDINVYGYYAELTSMDFLGTYTTYSQLQYYSLDYDMFYDVLPLLVGTNSDFNNGYTIGYDKGLQDGTLEGFNQGENYGKEIGREEGRTEGYLEGYHDGSQGSEVINSIYSGILSIGFLPINFFLAIFNFEILGINLSAFVSSILSVCVVIIVIKRVFSTESGD